MGLPDDLFSKLNVKALGGHLANYADLYIKPLKVWRKILSNRKDGYDLFVLHLIYYCLFLFSVVKNFAVAIPLVILEVVITLIPFLFFVLPFYLFIKLYKKQIKWVKVFRLFVIIKLQFIPVLILLYLINQSTKIESLYVLSDNMLWVIWLAFILIPPVVVKLKVWQKMVWILANYISFLISFAFINVCFEKVDSSGEIFDRLTTYSPNAEYTRFEVLSMYSQILFDDSHYFILISDKPDSGLLVSKTQFVSFDLLRLFTKTRLNQPNSDFLVKDSSNRFLDTTSKDKNSTGPYKDSSVMHYKKGELTLNKLDSFRNSQNELFYAILNLSKNLMDSAKFESNRKYFKAFFNYLTSYESSYRSSKDINQILANSSIEGAIRFEDNSIGAMLKVDSDYYNRSKGELILIEIKLEKRVNDSNFIFNILFYPLDLIFN